jgi:hypothetical protein
MQVPNISFERRIQLRAVIDRIIPADQDPGALDLGTDNYVFAQLEGEASEFTEDILIGLEALELASRLRFGAAFAVVPEAPRDILLAEVEEQPWFLGLAELTAEGFYADPANGGNRDALSWAIIGYQHRLPDGPSGRTGAEVAKTSGVLRRDWPYPPDDPAHAALAADTVRGE